MHDTTANRPTFERIGRPVLQGYLVGMPVKGWEIQRMSPCATGEKASA